MVIWQYKLNVGHLATTMMELKTGSKLLSCQMQGDELCAWFLVNDGVTATGQRYFTVVGTGHELDHRIDLSWFICIV